MISSLTPRELEVLALVAEGLSNLAIADGLVIRLRTVEQYVNKIYSKLGLHNTAGRDMRVSAVLLYLAWQK